MGLFIVDMSPPTQPQLLSAQILNSEPCVLSTDPVPQGGRARVQAWASMSLQVDDFLLVCSGCQSSLPFEQGSFQSGDIELVYAMEGLLENQLPF